MSHFAHQTNEKINFLTGEIVDAYFHVHTQLGPGLIESVYEKCLKWELEQKGLLVESQYKVPIFYKSQNMESDLRIDLFVESTVIVELKSIDHILPIHKAQLITYLKLTQKKIGLLINFNVPVIRSGITRVIL
jgi:GxxExxY protein